MPELKIAYVFLILFGVSVIIFLLLKFIRKKIKNNTLNKQTYMQIFTTGNYGFGSACIICYLIAETSIQTRTEFITAIASTLICFFVFSLSLTTLYIHRMELLTNNARLLSYDTNSEVYLGPFLFLSLFTFLIGVCGIAVVGYYQCKTMFTAIIIVILAFMVSSVFVIDNIRRLNKIHETNEIYRNICDTYLYSSDIPMLQPEELLSVMKDLYKEVHNDSE